MDRDEELLLAVLNSAPVVDGRPTDDLGDAAGRELARRWGGVGTEDELEQLRRARDALQRSCARARPNPSRSSRTWSRTPCAPRASPVKASCGS